MKIATKQLSYEKAMAKKRPKHRKPLRPNRLLQLVIRVLAIFDLAPVRFTYEKHGMEKVGRKEPCLILMNHSSFIDLKIASKIFFPKRYGIVCTCDGFVGFGMSVSASVSYHLYLRRLHRQESPDAAHRLYSYSEVCDGCVTDQGYGISAEKEKMQRAHVSRGQLFF